ncbi:MAG: TerC family protein [Phycisphaerales bacterium]|nr:TerC family protein [Phycisphaerales bacterium]
MLESTLAAQVLLPALVSLNDSAGTSPPIAFFSAAGLIALLTLTTLEIVLGIDNVVFIAILANRLPKEQQAKARTIGLLLAMVMRLVLLALAFLIIKLDEPFYTVPWVEMELSGKSLILLGGGLFLIAKATMELHHMVEEGGKNKDDPSVRPGIKKQATATFGSVLVQVLLLDLVFSLDSVITAVGMTNNYAIMATAVIIAIGVMIAFAGPIARFVQTHPTMKTLALAFLVLIGVLLVAEGAGQHLPRGYIYFAMAFAIIVEVINMKAGHRKARAASADEVADQSSPIEG